MQAPVEEEAEEEEEEESEWETDTDEDDAPGRKIIKPMFVPKARRRARLCLSNPSAALFARAALGFAGFPIS